MELNKSILLLLLISSSLLSFFSEANCIPKYASNNASPDCLGPALSFISSTPTESPSPSPVSSSETEFSPLASPVSSPQPVPSPSDSPTNAPHGGLPYSLSVNNGVLNKICAVTRFQAECLATIAPYQTGATDPISVIKMEIQALHKHFEEALARGTKLSKDTSLEDSIKGSLDVCLECYDGGISDLNDALTALSSHDMDRLTQMLSAVVSYPETCKDAFTEQDEESPMKEVDQKLEKLASIAMDVSTLLPGVKRLQ